MGFMDSTYVSFVVISIQRTTLIIIAATVFEFILFLFVFYKACTSISARIKINQRISLIATLVQENTLYFFRYGWF